MRPYFVGSNIYRRASYGGTHPLAIARVETVIDLVKTLNWVRPDQYHTAPKAKPAAMLSYHTANYLEALQRAERDGRLDDETAARHGIGTFANPYFPMMYSRPATAVGGVLLASELVRAGGTVFVPGAGTHHGLADRANGFCYLNDPVILIKALKNQGLRVAYVDIDAHHCDGVVDGAANDALIISIHETRRWPFTGALTDHSAINCPVPAAMNDSEFALLRDQVVVPRLRAYAPDVIVLQCGADALAEDPLSRLSLSNGAYFDFVRSIMALKPARSIVLGGGGYNPWTVARCWSGIWAVLNEIDPDIALPPAAKDILRALSWSRTGKPAPHLFERLHDPHKHGDIRQEFRQICDYHAKAWAKDSA